MSKAQERTERARGEGENPIEKDKDCFNGMKGPGREAPREGNHHTDHRLRPDKHSRLRRVRNEIETRLADNTTETTEEPRTSGRSNMRVLTPGTKRGWGESGHRGGRKDDGGAEPHRYRNLAIKYRDGMRCSATHMQIDRVEGKGSSRGYLLVPFLSTEEIAVLGF